jgi:uroporphyrin-III C-methyltransferase
LIAAGLDRATPVLIACQVSLADERQLSTRLDLLDIATRAFADAAPTLILIGEAVRTENPGVAVHATAAARPG